MTDFRDATRTPAEALAEALRLEESGDRLAAIDVLMDSNRAQSDPEVEYHLVRIRHAAVEDIPHKDFTDPWPPPVPAEAFGVDESGPIPEINARDLTVGALRRGIFGSGGLIARNALTPEQIAPLVEGIDAALGLKDDAPKGGRVPPYYQQLKTPPEVLPPAARHWVEVDGGVMLPDSPHLLFAITEIYRNLGFYDIAEEFLGERPCMSAKKSTLRRIVPGDPAGWHQDGAFLGPGIRALNFWVALSHCGIDAPGLEIVPRRFEDIVETGTGGSYFDWAVGPAVVDELEKETPVVRPVFAPGDVFFFDEMYLHRTGMSEGMSKIRYAIELWCFAPSAYPIKQVPVVW